MVSYESTYYVSVHMIKGVYLDAYPSGPTSLLLVL